jgi:hypothetical protein
MWISRGIWRRALRWSDGSSNALMERFRLLPGLPATGPYPEQFSATGHGTHREGFVVEFFPEGDPPWIGNFQPGMTEFSAVLTSLHGKSLVVIAQGQGYEINPQDRHLIEVFGGGIEIALMTEPGLLVLGDGVYLEAYTKGGLSWRSRRISWDGMWNIRVESGKIKGDAWSPIDDCEYPFAVDLATGSVEGGSYSGPPD